MKGPEEAKKVEEIQRIRSRVEESFQIAELAKSILSEQKYLFQNPSYHYQT